MRSSSTCIELLAVKRVIHYLLRRLKKGKCEEKSQTLILRKRTPILHTKTPIPHNSISTNLGLSITDA